MITAAVISKVFLEKKELLTSNMNGRRRTWWPMCSFSGARVLQNTTLEVDRRILGMKNVGTEEFGIWEMHLEKKRCELLGTSGLEDSYHSYHGS